MRIAIMGTGGVGGYFGARLVQAGAEVHFIARGAHLAAIRENGLVIDSGVGEARLKVHATDRPEEIGPVDLVMFTVKLWDTEAAAEQIRPLIGPDTGVISFQNGIDGPDVLSRVLGPQHVMGGVCHIAAIIGAPGVIKHTGTLARLTAGEWDGTETPRLAAFAAACRAAQFEFVQSSDIRRAIWEKFVFLSSFSGVTTLLRQPIGPIRADADGRALFADAVAEACAVARALGIDLGDDYPAKVLAFNDGLPEQMKSSMLGDLERGARLELPWLSGRVVALGREKGVATPVHRVIWAALKPYAALA